MKVDDELREAVRKIVREEMEVQRRATQEPEHYDGEPCNLPVSLNCKDIAKGLLFEYTDTYGYLVRGNEWSVSVNNEIIYDFADVEYRIPHWILRAIPIIEVGKEYQWDGISYGDRQPTGIYKVEKYDDHVWPVAYGMTRDGKFMGWTTAEHLSPIEEPKCPYKAGDYLWVEVDEEFGRGCYAGICKVLEIVDTKIKYRMLNGSIDALPFENFRPLTDADWRIGNIGKRKVRAYRCERGGMWFKYDKGGDDYWGREEVDTPEAICEKFNIPIMPFELHKGEMRRPK